MVASKLCPICNGSRFVPTEGKSLSGRPIYEQCQNCKGTGFVLESEPAFKHQPGDKCEKEAL